jgi:hypothetical protein
MEEMDILYPVGVQDFKDIREGNFLYVDKTDLIYKLVRSSKFAFLSRPRRFGKSLLTSTLHYYLAGRKEFFTGLAIEKLEKDWYEYPVVHLDLSPAKRNSAEDLRKKLNSIIDEQDKKMQVQTSGTLGDRMESLIKQANEKYGRRVVLLVDEYDAPVMHVLHNSELLPEIREVMRELFEPLKACNTYLKFVFITGVSTFSQMGIFSELNNLDVITNDNEYASICGITQQELVDNFQKGIHELSLVLKCSEEETLSRLKDKYDGYHFTKSLLDIYNPFSLIKAFKSNDLGDYWFDTGTSTSLVNALRQYVGDFQFELDKINANGGANRSQFVRSLEDHASIIPLLYQSGYLTIKAYDEKEDLYLLDMPNAEVRIGLLKNLLPLYSAADPDETANAASRASTALREGNIDKAMEILRSALKSSSS